MKKISFISLSLLLVGFSLNADDHHHSKFKCSLCPKGTTGSQGPQGPIGSAGPTGATGPTGTFTDPNVWHTIGDAGTISGAKGSTTAGINFLGTTDPQNLEIRTNNSSTYFTRFCTTGQVEQIIDSTGNTFFGLSAGQGFDGTNTIDYVNNTFIGNQVGQVNATGGYNTAVGGLSLSSNTIGSFNSAYGFGSLQSNLSGEFNAAFGQNSLNQNTIGGFNAAFGQSSLGSNLTGSFNTAIGQAAMANNTAGGFNTAIGEASLLGDAMLGNTGQFNVAVGQASMVGNQSGNNNTAVGQASLISNTTGADNVAVGQNALPDNTIGVGNIAIGHIALDNNITGNNNIAIGNQAVVTVDGLENATAIGYLASVSRSDAMIFGGSGVTGWGFGIQIAAGDTFTVNNGAHLTTGGTWTDASDEAKKYDIQEINYGLNEVMDLHPVTYKLKVNDREDIGFIAQEVKNVIPEVVYGVEGDMSLSYSHITAVLTKALQEQQAQINNLRIENAEIKKELEQLKALIQ